MSCAGTAATQAVTSKNRIRVYQNYTSPPVRKPMSPNDNPVMEIEADDDFLIRCIHEFKDVLVARAKSEVNDVNDADLVSDIADYILRDLYRLASENKGRKAASLVVRKFTDLINRDRLDVCRAVFANADPSRLGSSSIVSLMGITAPVRDRIESRNKFICKAFEVIRSVEGEDAAKDIVDRYR